MKDKDLVDAANKMADEIDRRIRKGEIDFSWMENYFHEQLLAAARAAAFEERALWEADRG